MGILFVIAGIILENNEQWFNGADTVGLICLIVGIIACVVQLVMLFTVGGLLARERRRW